MEDTISARDLMAHIDQHIGPALYPGRIIFLAESGAHAYGHASQNSDHDVRGVFIYPAAT